MLVPASLTLRTMGPDDAHGTDPVRWDLRYQWVQDLQAGRIHHQDFWVVTVTEETSFSLSTNGELVKL